MMKKKVWLVLLAAVLVFGFAVFGCSSPSDDEPPAPPSTTDPNTPDGPQHFETTGPIVPVVWGEYPPVLGEDGFLSITASSSTGFKINFADIGYTLNREDSLVFTYQVTVTTPVAIITAKNPSGTGNNTFNEFGGDSDWGIGKGREYVLGNIPTGKSVYEATEGRKVAGTWDAATNTGTFEVLMKYLSSSATAIGFQHNVWADFNDGTGKVAEGSVYKLKITKIENKAGEAPPPPPPPTGSEWFDNAVALKTGIGTYSGGNATHALDEDTGIITLDTTGGSGGFWVSLPAGFTVADTVSIQYACLNVSDDLETQEVKFIKKQGSGWTDVGDASKYPTFNTTEVSTVTVTGFNAAGVTAGKASFQTNGTFKAKLKIISVTRIPGADIKITTAVPGLKPITGGTPKTTVDNEQYSGTVAWKDSSNADVTGNFVQGGVYTATIVLTKKTSYTFDGIDANTFPVTDATTVTHVAGTAAATTLSITAAFPAATVANPVVVWKPTITATTDIATRPEYIANTGIKRDATDTELVFGVLADGFTVKVLSGTYKQFCVQVGTDAGGSNYYYTAWTPPCAAGTDYTVTFMVSGSGQLRLNGNGAPSGSDPWAKTVSVTSTPTEVTYSWTQSTTGGNLKFDTGDSAVNTVITITGIKITTP